MNTNNLFSRLEKSANVDYIEGEIYLTDDPDIVFSTIYPHKNDAIIACICTDGELTGKINLRSVHVESPGLLVALDNQILQFDKPECGFKGVFIIMSKQFTEKISLAEGFSTFLSIRDVPYIPLNEQLKEGLMDYYNMVKKVLHNTGEDFNRKAVVNHLTIAFFYGIGYYLHKLTDKDKKTRNEIITEDFLQLVQKHYKQQRSMEFYADKLYITSKYLSISVKNSTGKTARQWIDDYVTLEAKLLLKTTNMSIKQIGDELNFPSQSFFGKYFKRGTGMSPKEYKMGS